jgi:hypothetical protein
MIGRTNGTAASSRKKESTRLVPRLVRP